MSGETKIGKLSSLKEIFTAFDNLRVLIIGDVMIDSYLWGKVERISPEAPVPIVNVQRRDKRLGGAGNVALNISAMGATPILCSMIGEDLDGDNLITLVENAGLSAEGILRTPSRITTIKHRIMSGSYHILRVDSEIDTEINEAETTRLIDKAKELIPSCDVIIFQDYDKGVLNKKVIEAVSAFAKSKNIPTVVDPKKRNFLHYKNISLFKPNRKELREGLKIDWELNDIDEIEKSVDLLRKSIDVNTILITLSEKGIFISDNGQKHLIPAHLREISDVSGAGDTVISIAALCYAMNLSPKFLASLSNLGGGLVCEHVGVIPIDKKILLEEALKLKLQELLLSTKINT